MTDLALYLNLFKDQESCITFKPSSPEEIDRINEYLISKRFCPLPLEFIQFLKQTNGFIFNGIELFGSIPHYRAEKKYIFPDLEKVNSHYDTYMFFTKKVILGRMSESILTYDSKDGFYSVVDRMKLRSRFETKTFQELLKYLTKYIA
ncbi:MAG: YrhA family protein [Lactobacillus sp.]|jgi:hypothetical protein|nr:YrhA family protein [Lactobacillus sp.]